MPAEKQNNEIGERLEGMKELPSGFQFRAEKVWNRLEPQLKKQSINYRAVFFAAASVIAIIIFIAMPFKKGNDESRTAGGSGKITTEIKNENQDITPKQSQLTADHVEKFSKQAVINYKKSIPAKLPADNKQPKIEVLQQNSIPEEPVAVADHNIQSSHSAAITAAPKRRFPVAHVNDLNKPVLIPEEPAEKRIASLYPFKKPVAVSVSSASREDDGYPEQKKLKSLFLNTNSH